MVWRMLCCSATRESWQASPICSSGLFRSRADYPAVDPLDSTSRQLDSLVVGQEHYDAARCRRPCSATRSFGISSPPSAWTSCPRRTSSRCRGRARSSAFSDTPVRTQDIDEAIALEAKQRAEYARGRKVPDSGSWWPLVAAIGFVAHSSFRIAISVTAMLNAPR